MNALLLKTCKRVYCLALLFIPLCALAQTPTIDGDNCPSDGWGEPLARDASADFSNAATSNIDSLWALADENYLYIGMARGAEGQATWNIWLDMDCDATTGDVTNTAGASCAGDDVPPNHDGAERWIVFGTGNGPGVVNFQVLDWNNATGTYETSTSADFLADAGRLDCAGDLNLFMEMRISLPEFDICSDDPNACLGPRITNVLSQSGGIGGGVGGSNSQCADYLVVDYQVQVNSPPVAAFNTPSTGCEGLEASFDASISTDNEPIIEYAWDFDWPDCNANGTGFSADLVGNETMPTYTYPAAGTYNVGLRVTDGSGCVTYVCNPVIVAGVLSGTVDAASEDLILCSNESVDLEVSLTGGTAPYMFNWSSGGSSSIETVSPSVTTTYSVTITDANGCEAIASNTVVVAGITATCSIDQPISCPGNADGQVSVTIGGGTPPYNISWSNGSSGTTNAGLSGGTYSVTVTDDSGSGCVAICSVDLFEPDPLEPNCNVVAEVGCAGNDGVLAVNPTGGTAPYTINWSNGDSQETLTGLVPGRYAVTITDAMDCEVSCSLTVIKDCPCDTNPPIFEVPADTTIKCTDPLPEWPVIVAIDPEEGELPVTTSVIERLDECGGYLDRSWSSVDSCGNSFTLSQRIQIIDDTPPLILAPADVTIQCGDALPADEPMVSDNCTEVTLELIENTDQLNACEFIMTRTWVATDACGNSSTAVQTITQEDNTAPEIVITNPLLAGVQSGQVLTMEGCEPPNVSIADAQFFDCCALNIEPYDILVATHACNSLGFFRRFECGYIVTDAAGNTTHFRFFMDQYDNQPPQFIDFPASLDVDCGEEVPPLEDVMAVDNCAGELNVVVSENSFGEVSNDGSYAITRTWSVQDHCGNIATETQLINVCGFDENSILGDIGLNTIWEDRNGNGVQEPDEPGINGVMVYLYRVATSDEGEALQVIDSVTTTIVNGIDGQFGFTYREAGRYALKIIPPETMYFTIPNGGENDMLDSDADPITGMIMDIELEGGAYLTGLHAGLLQVAILPVDLVEFTLSSFDCQTELRWTTANEQNLSHFVIESSINGVDFEPVGHLSAVGDSEYLFSEMQNSAAFYRLEMIDLDGTVSRSAIRKYNPVGCVTSRAEIVPNPVHHVARLRLPEHLEAPQITVVSAYGQIFDQFVAGSASANLDLSRYAPGVYMIVVQDREYQQTLKLVKE